MLGAWCVPSQVLIVILSKASGATCGPLRFIQADMPPKCRQRYSHSVEPIVMPDRNERPPPVNKPATRKQGLRSDRKSHLILPGNTRIADQNRRLLGKHYANKYRTGRQALRG
jgi:hypothetical protein